AILTVIVDEHRNLTFPHTIFVAMKTKKNLDTLKITKSTGALSMPLLFNHNFTHRLKLSPGGAENQLHRRWPPTLRDRKHLNNCKIEEVTDEALSIKNI
ncbi:hypothetical protein L9F63_004098, partial [Diploptera punctata]